MKSCETLPEGKRFYVLFPAQAGLAETQRNGDTGGSEEVPASPQSQRRPRPSTTPRQSITAHVMSLMQRGFTRLYSRRANH